MADSVQLKVATPTWERLKAHAGLADVPAAQLANRLLVETMDAVEAEAAQEAPIVTYLRSLRARKTPKKKGA